MLAILLPLPLPKAPPGMTRMILFYFIVFDDTGLKKKKNTQVK